ncbi:hypothetical protein ROHU_016509 [Labeo rohita]|uniref:Uncharacterized protein n=1 Tax=Labeo rohita TaxID=84645 RepID=A0A498NJK0_LABRO|nr:hypothetical protein ROHU_016509 [Labeo rohita]
MTEEATPTASPIAIPKKTLFRTVRHSGLPSGANGDTQVDGKRRTPNRKGLECPSTTQVLRRLPLSKDEEACGDTSAFASIIAKQELSKSKPAYKWPRSLLKII